MNYTVRVSPKARRVRITVTHRAEVIVSIPPRFARKHVPGIVEARREWIAAAVGKAVARLDALVAEHGDGVPESVFLRATGERFEVSGRDGDRAAARERQGGLLLTGPPGDDDARLAALRRWLTRKAKTALSPVLAELALSHGFKPPRLRIGHQRSRWGSCSARGTVSLNAKLMFLPPELVRYVIVHELCHLAVMDHSPAFWALLGEHEPRAQELRVELKRAEHLVPPWAI